MNQKKNYFTFLDRSKQNQKEPERDHIVIISLLNYNGEYLHSMTIDFPTNTFCVSRSSTIDYNESRSSKYLDFDMFTKSGKALIERYGRFDFKDGDLEDFQEMLIELFDVFVLGKHQLN